jgi:hypothetical protein
MTLFADFREMNDGRQRRKEWLRPARVEYRLALEKNLAKAILELYTSPR